MFAKTLRRTLCSLWGSFVLLGAGTAVAGFADTLNLREGVTFISQKVFDLHMLIFWICVVACVAVFAVLIYSIFTHRKSKGAVPATFHESTTVEIIWTTIPFLILVAMVLLFTPKTKHSVSEPPGPPLGDGTNTVQEGIHPLAHNLHISVMR